MNFPIAHQIEEKIKIQFPEAFYQLTNESHLHGGPALESHFKLILVSVHFEGVGRVKRHQSIYQLLEEEMQQGVHALSLNLYTQEEWDRRANDPTSPKCMGGE